MGKPEENAKKARWRQFCREEQVCYDCGEPVFPGRTRCRDHLKLAAFRQSTRAVAE